jgi:hypothetical protein
MLMVENILMGFTIFVVLGFAIAKFYRFYFVERDEH